MNQPAISAQHAAALVPQTEIIGVADETTTRTDPLHPPRADELDALAAGLKPLSNPVRLRLLRHLTEPRYLEEIASHLGLTRQGVQRHVRLLQQAGLVERRPGSRPSGAVVEYSVSPQALFALHEELERLTALRVRRSDVMHRTRPGRARGLDGHAASSCLVLVRGPRWGDRIALPLGRERAWVIGRDDRCDVVVDYDPYASNRHAELRWSGGRFAVTDLRSTNGTTVNLASVPRGGSTTARHGDLIGVGRTLLLLWEQAPPLVGGR